MKPITSIRQLLQSALLLLFSLHAGHAAVVVNVDLNGMANVYTPVTYSGVGAATDTGTLWNGVSVPQDGGGSPVTATNLLGSTGVTTSVGITLNNPVVSYSADQTSDPTSILALLGDLVYNPGYTTSTPSSFSITGLTVGGSYDLYLYGSSVGPSPTQFTIGGTTLAMTGSNSSVSSFSQNVNYVLFSSVVADGSGDILGTWSQTPAVGTAGSGHFSGFQLVADVPVPEPSSLALMFGGAIAVAVLSSRLRSTRRKRI